MKRAAVLLSVAMSAVLASCGGSDDQSGSPTAFSVVPNDISVEGAPPTVTGATGSCASGATTTEVFVYGGVAPYRLDNTVPNYVSLNKTTVDDKGGSFLVTF